jgi:hypothetical protein
MGDFAHEVARHSGQHRKPAGYGKAKEYYEYAETDRIYDCLIIAAGEAA